ncbi:hypothetical protein GF377_07245 [candidate division GN15 bacterium]|nr:hypothetical protein [candidate division GN15 bacterium]
MEQIHLKTIDTISQHLLREAQKSGIELAWDRYERQQPQDGFLRLGLNCPYGCLQGPCRIDPFNRGAQRSICGLGRDEMAASMLLRLCLHGALEAWAWFKRASDPQFPEPGDLGVAATMLHRPSSSYRQLTAQALRLSELVCDHLGRQSQEAGRQDIPYRIGYGTLVEQPVCIGISGLVEPDVIEALTAAGSANGDAPVAFVSLGDWLETAEGFLPFACTSGEAELAVLSGALQLLVVGPGTDRSLSALCRTLEIPVVEASSANDWQEVVNMARRGATTAVQTARLPDNLAIRESRIHLSPRSLIQEATNTGVAGLAILGGSDSPHASLGQLPVELADGLRADGFLVAGWGDVVLWHTKFGHTDPGDAAVMPLETVQGPLTVARELLEAGLLKQLKGICFTSVKSSWELTLALGLAQLGCRVAIGSPVPIMGSQPVRETLADILSGCGGELYLFDHPATSDELRQWIGA